MRKFLLILALAIAPSAFAQGMLPTGFSGWTAFPGGGPQASTAESLSGDEAAILRDCGLASTESRSYSRGDASLAVTLYRMTDPTSAYSAYSFLRPENASGVKPIAHSTVSRDRALLLVGEFLLDVQGRDLPHLAGDLKALSAAIAPRANQAPYPDLGQHLPLRDLIPRSDRYLPGPALLARALPLAGGDWLGFSDGAEAELARYRINGHEVTLLIAAYPTQQLAANRMGELGKIFEVNPAAQPTNTRPVVFARRVSSLLALVSGADSSALADPLLQQIDYRSEVTWNAPSFSFNEPSISVYIVGAIVGTGIILLFALIAGIAFGGVRILVKLFLPGAVFDRGSSIEILQLGLSSKPIEAKDFYELRGH